MQKIPRTFWFGLTVLIGLVGACGDDQPEDTDLIIEVDATITPDPPVVGDNVLRLTITETDVGPLTGATVVVTPSMPMHGHGGDPAVVSEIGNGVYEATPISFTMPGQWEVKVDVSVGDRSATAVVNYDVP